MQVVQKCGYNKALIVERDGEMGENDGEGGGAMDFTPLAKRHMKSIAQKFLKSKKGGAAGR